MTIQELRRQYHKDLCREILGLKKGIPNFADKDSDSSVAISRKLIEKLRYPLCPSPPKGQTVGAKFSSLTMEFLRDSFKLLQHIRPGDWVFSVSQAKPGIAAYDQYEHLAALAELLRKTPSLKAGLGGDYLITPDIVIGRTPVADSVINSRQSVIKENDQVSVFTPLRAANTKKAKPILHASISCKWTMRSDRAQNTRTEALNLIRNRKGRTPNIIAVTAEPMPTRLASIAMGTGDIDCVYHMALSELIEALKETKNADQMEVLSVLVEGRRLRDISDLPFDLAV
jgi:hypothetical protein